MASGLGRRVKLGEEPAAIASSASVSSGKSKWTKPREAFPSEAFGEAFSVKDSAVSEVSVDVLPSPVGLLRGDGRRASRNRLVVSAKSSWGPCVRGH